MPWEPPLLAARLTAMGNSHHRRRRSARLATLLVSVGAIAAVGCTGSGDDAATSGAASADETTLFSGSIETAPADTFGGGEAEQPASERATGTGMDPTFDPAFDIGRIGRQVVIEMRVTMTSPDLRAAVDGILRSAASQGGGVAASDVDFGTESRPGSAVVVVKVPPDALSAFLSGLERLGTVDGVSQDAQDVTDQLTDLEVRIANARRSVERIRALLTEAATLGEVIDLEAELTRRQTDLERFEASQRSVADRVALSTVTIEVRAEGAPTVVEVDEDDGIVDAFRAGAEAFTAVLFGVAFVLAVLAPFLAVAVVLALVVWMVVRGRRRGGRATARSVPSSSVSPDDDRGVTIDDPEVASTELTGTGAAPTPQA